METPSSMRRLTRSLASAPSQKSKQDDALSRSRNSGNPDRSALLDITNDSPIVGLAAGGLVEKTPSSSVAKNRVNAKRTPGSGEALLRGQVKTLLQKVEEEGELVSKLSFGEERPPLRVLMGLPVSPALLLLAPTPANTPQIPNLCGSKEDVLMGDLIIPSAPEEDDPKIPSEVAENNLKQGGELNCIGANECLINRALLFDSPGKSEMSDDSSTISYQGSGRSYREKSSEDDNSSAWSLQVNPSIQEEDEGVDDFEEEEADVYHEGVEEEDEDCYDDLCEGLMKMSVQEEDKIVGLPEFAGKHTRFVYNSDGDIEGEEEVEKKIVSPGVLLLKGLPAPEGKHLRFQEEEE